MRTALQLDISGHKLFGTMHGICPPVEKHNNGRNLGVLLLSFGQQPRSWVGDLGSSIADRLEAQGNLVFRFDMPGLGDTAGDIPVYLEELWRDILLGAHEAPLHDLCEELVRRYALNGLVVGGFCGGAITALYSVNAGSPWIKGLILLEPEMALVRTASSISAEKANPLTIDAYQESREIVFKRLISLASWKKLFGGNADLSFWIRLFRSLFHYGLYRVHTLLKKDRKFPPETNIRMMDSWELARKLKIPTLVVTVGSANRSKYYQAYGLNPGEADTRTRLNWVEVPNTTHAMLTGGAKEAVGELLEQWVIQNFPLKVPL